MANVFEKLQKVRSDLTKVKMKKSGKNTFQNYDYFELVDFLPTIQVLCDRHGITPVVTFDKSDEVDGKREARLTVYNNEDRSDNIVFTCPFILCELKSANKIQCLGSSITYLRRYLYQTAFELVEFDGVDGLSVEDRVEPEPPKPVDKEKETLLNEIKSKIKTDETIKAKLKEVIKETGATGVNDLTKENLQDILGIYYN